MIHTTRARRALATTLTVPLLLLAACGDDDDVASVEDATEDATEDTTEDTTADTTEDDADTVDVALVDYGYEGLPSSVAAGTTFTVSNRSETELHELVAIRVPDGEDRSAAELFQLPEEELMPALFGSGPPEPAAVLLATPGSDETIPAVGDGTLSEPGRYVVACFIPTGADPQEYLQAAATSEGPPEVAGGPPHFTQGMFAELNVE